MKINVRKATINRLKYSQTHTHTLPTYILIFTNILFNANTWYSTYL